MDRDHLYRDYITIVFGLVATKGLEQIADRAFHSELSWSQAPFFLGAFIVGIHFWYVCVVYAGISGPTYQRLADLPKTEFRKSLSRIIFFGVPVVFVSAYAGTVVMFFYAIPGRYDLLFRAFWVLLLASLINDFWGLATTAYAQKGAAGDVRTAVQKALKLNGRWFLLDLIYFAVFWIFVYHRVISLSASHPVAAGMAFLGLIALGVLLDAPITPSS
jgi:hypothetical protein